jgi:hypothetical protein
VELYDPSRLVKTNMIFSMAVEKINHEVPGSVSIYESHQFNPDHMKNFDLMLVSYGQWKDLSKSKTPWISFAPSILILKHKAGSH